MENYLLADRHRFFIRYLLSYILILVIPLIISLITYYNTLNLIREEVVESNKRLLDQSKAILDERLSEVELLVQQIVSNPRVISFQDVRDPFEKQNTYRVIETSSMLINYSLANHFIYEYYLLFKNSGLALTADTTYRLPAYYQNLVQYVGLDYSDWYKLFLGQHYQKKYLPAHEIMIQGKKRSMVTYLQSLGYPNFVQGAVMVLIDNNEIQNLLKGLDVSDGGWAYIADENGNVISSFSVDPGLPSVSLKGRGKEGVFNEKINGRDFTVTFTSSASNGWTYVAAQPSHIVFKKVNNVSKITILVLIIALAVGILMSYLLAYKNSKPIKTLVNLIMERYHGTNHRIGGNSAYGLIESTLTDLFKDNEELQIRMREQAPYLKAAFFEGLFKGKFQNQTDIETLSNHIGVSLNGKYYIVTILKLHLYGVTINKDILIELDRHRIIVKEILNRLTEGKGLIYDADQEKIILLSTYDFEGSSFSLEYHYRMIYQAKEEMNTPYQIHPIFSVGGIYENLVEVSRSYEEARQALISTYWDINNDVLSYNDNQINSKAYYYPSRVEISLMNFVKTGNQENAGRLLDELHKKNVMERNLPPAMLRLFFYELSGTAVKIIEQLSEGHEGTSIDSRQVMNISESFDDPEHAYMLISRIYEQLCEDTALRKKGRYIQLITGINEFIASRYLQSDLSLMLIAEHFHMSEVYLSQFYKDQTGVNISDYVEELRMKKARELLLTTDLPVNEIAHSIGYTSSNSFGRAFRRKHGINATEYRRDEPKDNIKQ